MSHTGGYHSGSDSNCEREREKLARMDESETRERTRERLGTILRQQYGASSAKVDCYSRESRKQYQRLVSDFSIERSTAAEWIPPRATRQFRGGITGAAVPFNASELSSGKCRDVGSSPAVSRKCTEDSRRLRRKEPRALLRFIPRVFSPQSSAWLPVSPRIIIQIRSFIFQPTPRRSFTRILFARVPRRRLLNSIRVWCIPMEVLCGSHRSDLGNLCISMPVYKRSVFKTASLLTLPIARSSFLSNLINGTSIPSRFRHVLLRVLWHSADAYFSPRAT